MFSAILEFFEKMAELKLRKQKKVTKTETKKVEKDSKADIVTTQKNKDKNPKIKDSKEKEKKLKGRVWALRISKWIVTVIEQIITWIISLIGIYGFFIILVVLVLMIAIYGLLHIDTTVLDSIFTKVSAASCINSAQSLADSGFDMSQFSQLSGTLTGQDKHLLNSVKIYTEIFSGKFGDPTEIFNEDYKKVIKSLDTKTNVAATMGFMSIENGFNFPGTDDILTTPTSTQPDGNNDAWLGLEAEQKDFDGVYEGKKFYTETFVNNFKKVYSNPTLKISCYNYAPYGMATQIGFLSNKYNELPAVHEYIDTKVPELASKFGITQNVEKLTALCHYFMLANQYHGHYRSMEDGELGYWVALWAMTSENDSSRGFDKIVLNADNIDESTYRGEFLGYSSYPGTYVGKSTTITNLTYVPDSQVNGKIKVNGQAITAPLIKVVADYCDSKGLSDVIAPALSDLDSRKYAPKLETAVLNQNYNYGLMAYLAGLKVMEKVGVSMPTASGGNYEDCDCVEVGGSGSVGNVDISNIVVGEPQGIYPSNIRDALKQFTKYQPYYGRLDSVSSPNDGINGSGTMTREEWRQQSKWKVPYQYQTSAYDTWQSDESMWRDNYRKGNACPIYMQAYIYSAMTGRVVNCQEIMAAQGVYQNNGQPKDISVGWNTGMDVFCSSMAKDAGFYVRAIAARSFSSISDVYVTDGAKDNASMLFNGSNVKELIDSTLENGGIVGVNTSMSGSDPEYVSGDSHFFVITEKKGDNQYMTHCGTYISSDLTPHKLEEIVGNNGSWFHQSNTVTLMLAYNPNIGKNNGSSLSTDFSNFLFIGDSFTDMLEGYVSLTGKGHQVVAAGSARPAQFVGVTTGDKEIGLDTTKKTVNLSSITDVNGVVVLLGVNGLTEVDSMKSLLTELKTKYSDKPIYVQKVFPVGSNHWSGDAPKMITDINKYNDDIKSFCDSTDGFQFIDTTDGLVGSDGYLLNADGEGTHINDVPSYTKWFENIEKAITGGNNANSNSYSINCISTGSGGSSIVSDLDWDVDVVDKSEYTKPSWGGNNYGDFTPEEVKFIVVHYWGWTNPTYGTAETAFIDGYHGGGYEALAQFMIDKDTIYRTAPELKKVYHCGGSDNEINYMAANRANWGLEQCTNRNAIGIEVANVKLDTSVNKYYYEKSAVEKTVKLVKALMVKYNIDVDHVYRHFDCTSKICPAPFIDGQFDGTYGYGKGHDLGQSHNWVAFKKCLQSDTIDWSWFDEYVIEDVRQ